MFNNTRERYVEWSTRRTCPIFLSPRLVCIVWVKNVISIPTGSVDAIVSSLTVAGGVLKLHLTYFLYNHL
jgi:hypothetical protein